jgi:hypothetical protein
MSAIFFFVDPAGISWLPPRSAPSVGCCRYANMALGDVILFFVLLGELHRDNHAVQFLKTFWQAADRKRFSLFFNASEARDTFAANRHLGCAKVDLFQEM